MHSITINVSDNKEEIRQHGTSMFPIALYDEHFSQFTLGEVPMHWHQEVEFVVVMKGSTKVHLLNESYLLKQGEGVFVNANTLHRFTDEGEKDCRILNVVFDPILIGGSHVSIIYQKYVRPIIQNERLKAIKFDQVNTWSKETINELLTVFDLLKHNEQGSELLTRSHLSTLWLKMITQTDHLTSTQKNNTSDLRIESAIKYIHNNLTETLTVGLISQAAFISETECYRLFKQYLGLTPMEYVLNQRLQLASMLLLESDDSIVNIALNCGFNSSSYFSKKFKNHYHQTPKEFRQQN